MRCFDDTHHEILVTLVTSKVRALHERHSDSPGFSDEPGLFSSETLSSGFSPARALEPWGVVATCTFRRGHGGCHARVSIRRKQCQQHRVDHEDWPHRHDNWPLSDWHPGRHYSGRFYFYVSDQGRQDAHIDQLSTQSLANGDPEHNRL